MAGPGPDRPLTRQTGSPVDLTVWFDYHCPYSQRAVEWLLGLGREVVRPRFRPFPLEQVNHDPAAAEWRLWEQPLDYLQYRGRQDRRSLAGFLATALLEATEAGPVVDRFRLAVYRARFEEQADIADLELLERLAEGAGADAAHLAAAVTSDAALGAARATIADAWRDARAEWAIFGVPTLQPAGEPPFYLRLERAVAPGAEALELFARLLDLRRAAPFVVEIKLPERADGVEG